jgi:UDP-N-acetylmuramyl pentapeptide synthase
LIKFLGPEDWVLVKGSRGARMEEIVKQLEAIDA